MSGTPKEHEVRLRREQQRRIEEERRRNAEEETRRRKAAMEAARREKCEESRGQLMRELDDVEQEVWDSQSSLLPDDLSALVTMCRSLASRIQQAQTEPDLQGLAFLIDVVETDLSSAQYQKRFADEEQKRLNELERQKFECQELERHVGNIPENDALKFDPHGYADARAAVRSAADSLGSGDPRVVRSGLSRASVLVERHTNAVYERRAKWRKQRALGLQAVNDLSAEIAGLRTDAIVMRWVPDCFTELNDMHAESSQAFAAEEFDLPAKLLSQAKSRVANAVSTANAAQIKADQRDYIMQSISASLTQLGFVVGKPEAEHPDHPATAMVLSAAAGTGKTIAVSVPVDGRIWYNVDGYPKTTEAVVGGGTAAVCDEAESVLNDMRERLDSEFGLESDELTWEGKIDPNRVLAQKRERRTVNQRTGGNSQ